MLQGERVGLTLLTTSRDGLVRVSGGWHCQEGMFSSTAGMGARQALLMLGRGRAKGLYCTWEVGRGLVIMEIHF